VIYDCGVQTVRAKVIPDFTEFDSEVEKRKALLQEMISLPPLGEAGERYQIGTFTTGMTAAVAPIAPPREWFEMEEPNEVTPMTYTDDGRVYGHLAPWDQCHAGLSAGAFSECVTAPRSASDYSRFHLGEIATAEGERIAVGKIVLATGHAAMSAGIEAATRHYDHTGAVGAFVRARNGRLGIWASGVVRSDLSPEQLRDLRANPVSGDWRSYNGNLELVAALAVPVPGFPIPRAQLSLSASGAIDALILTDVAEEEPAEPAERDREYLRRRNAILASVQGSSTPE
jgi:hypothetical protein